MVGRDRELERLEGVFADAEAGRGGLFLLAGEAGVGKTRLAEAAIAAAELAPLRGIAARQGSTPYAPLTAVLRDYLRNEPDGFAASETLIAHLGALLPELGHRDSTDRETLFQAVRRALEAIAAARPTVVFLDDLQWADAATLELLPSIAAEAEDLPLLMLGAYRSDEIPRGHALRRLRTDLRRAGRLAQLDVEPLDAEATAHLAEPILGGPPGPTLRSSLYDRTVGVPFFVEELAAALEEGGRLEQSRNGLELGEGAAVPIPETVRDAVRLRTEGLSEEGRACLEAAAAVGVRVELDLLAALDRDAGLDEVMERGLLEEVEPGVAAFRHDLAREAFYADTVWPARRALHRSIAALLETRGAEARVVADHWLAAGEPDRARPRLLEAARRFCDLHAYRDAAAAGRSALEAWPEGDDEPGRLDVLDELGRCAELCGELAEAERAWEEVAAGLAGSRDLRRRAEVQQRLATVYSLWTVWAKAEAASTAAAEAFEEAGLHAEATTEWLRAVDLQADVDDEIFRRLDRAADAAARTGRGDLEARCLMQRGHWLSVAGQPDEGVELVRKALALALEGGHVEETLWAYWALGAILSAWGNLAEAQSAFEEAIEFCRLNDRLSDEDFCVGCLAVVLRNRGEWKRANELGRDLLARPAIPDIARAHALQTCGLIAALRGSTKEARPLLDEALAIARKYVLPGSVSTTGFSLALLDELDGIRSARWEELVAPAPGLFGGSYASGIRWASIFAARRGDSELLGAAARPAADWLAQYGSADGLAALAHVLGEIALMEGPPERACEQFAQAIDRLADLNPFDRALTQMRSGVALAAAGERELGVEALTSAYRTFKKLGARPFAAMVATDLDELGERVEKRLGRRAAAELERHGLTRRELEILRLVAVGRTNREIAHQLFLSPRTVDMHVRNMLGKLDCRSRTEATGKAHELGLLEPATASI